MTIIFYSYIITATCITSLPLFSKNQYMYTCVIYYHINKGMSGWNTNKTSNLIHFDICNMSHFVWYIVIKSITCYSISLRFPVIQMCPDPIWGKKETPLLIRCFPRYLVTFYWLDTLLTVLFPIIDFNTLIILGWINRCTTDDVT